MITTVGELKAFLEDLDDSMPIIAPARNRAEQGNYLRGVEVKVSTFNTSYKRFKELFEDKVYYKSTFYESKDGLHECLLMEGTTK